MVKNAKIASNCLGVSVDRPSTSSKLMSLTLLHLQLYFLNWNPKALLSWLKRMKLNLDKINSAKRTPYFYRKLPTNSYTPIMKWQIQRMWMNGATTNQITTIIEIWRYADFTPPYWLLQSLLPTWVMYQRTVFLQYFTLNLAIDWKYNSKFVFLIHH